MPPAGFEPTLSAAERPKTYALDRAATGTGNRNEYREYFRGEGGKGGRCVGLKTLPCSLADYLNIWEPHPPETLRNCPGL